MLRESDIAEARKELQEIAKAKVELKEFAATPPSRLKTPSVQQLLGAGLLGGGILIGRFL